MKLKTPYFEIEIENLFIIVSIILLLFSNFNSFFISFYTCYLFIIFHELAHIYIASIFGKDIEKLRFSLAGVCVYFSRKKYDICKKKVSKFDFIINILIYIAGPLSNFFLSIIFYNIKMIHEINLFLGLLNLIPIYPLDGYNILQNILFIIYFDNDICKKKINIINKIMIFIFVIFCILFSVTQKNISSIIFLLYIYILNKSKFNTTIPKYNV